MSGLVGFILTPHVMCILYGLFYIIGNREYDKKDLKIFIFSALYPVSVPVRSVYCSCREIFLGEDWTENTNTDFHLTAMKMLKMFEYIGEFYVPNN